MNNLAYILNIAITTLIIPFYFNTQTAEAKTINFEHLNRDNGLPVNSITCIAQDKAGFIWMGSLQGLVKYDGNNYKTFTSSYGNPTGLPGHLLTQIICADDGFIYLTQSDNGFSVLDPKTELFTNFRMEDPATRKRANINDMVIDRHGNIWMGMDNGLLFFDTKTHQITKLSFVNKQVASDSTNKNHNYISALTIDKHDNLYILGYNSTLSYYDTKKNNYTPIIYSEKTQESIFLFNSGQLKIFENDLWITTETNGIYIYDLTQNKTKKHLFQNKIISYIKKIQNQIWIGTDGSGVYILDVKGNLETHLQNNPFDQFSLSSDAVYSIYESRDRTVWIGCYATGANLYNASRHKFSSISEIGTEGNKLTNKSIICLQAKNDSILLMGTDGGGINQLNLSTGIISLLKSKNGVLDKIVAKTISMNNDNSFYLGTYGKGLFHCTFNANNSVSAKQIEREFMGKYKHVWWIHNVSDTNIWLGYLHSGLTIYNPKKGTYNDLQAFSEHNIQTIKEIDNTFWVSSEQKGISICNKYGEIIKHYENDTSDPNSLSSNYVLEIFKDSRGRIWLGTNTTGLNLMENPNTEKFISINNTYGFPAEMITNIEEDANGLLWVSTNMGLVKYNPSTHESELFDNKDGLQGRNFNINSSYNHSNKTLYFGGVDGLSSFHPYQIQRNDIEPQVAITRLIVGNKPVGVNEEINGRIILNKPIEYLSNLVLSYKDEDFIIEFSALHYESSPKNQYKYKLEGFDDEWITTKLGQPSARYTNLKKGNFVFKVKAANADKVWNNTPIELPIYIKPPFYLTYWFYFLSIICGLIVITFFIRFRTQKLSNTKTMLENLIQERTKELEAKATTVMEQNEEISSINQQLGEYNKTRDRIFSIIAHDLKSPLNAIISFSSLLYNDFINYTDDEKRNYLNIITQTSTQMNGLIMNLLYWVNSQIGKITPNPTACHIKKVFDEVEAISEANSLQKNIIIEYVHNNAQVYADYEMLVTIIRNLVANSIKFTPADGRIIVDAFENNNRTTLTVTDTGVGMTKEQIEAINNNEAIPSKRGTQNEGGTGLGLYLCKDFTKKNNGRFIIDSNEFGTTISITFPSSDTN